MLGKLLSSIGSRSAEEELPLDALAAGALKKGRAFFQAHAGLPAIADGLAYEPTQRLLAVSCSDGRIKVLGGEGVEGLLLGSASPTRQLLFLAARGALVRLAACGTCELFGLDGLAAASHGGSSGAQEEDGADGSAPLSSLRLDDDQVCCVAALQQEPYLLLGCVTGSVRVAALVNASGDEVCAARQVRALQLRQWTIPPRKLAAAGRVLCLSVLEQPPQHRVLTVHEGSGAAVWDVRAQTLLALINHSSEGGAASGAADSAITAAVWLPDSSRGDFATGHASGCVSVWAMPPGCGSAAAAKQAEPAQQPEPQPLRAQLLSTLWLSGPEQPPYGTTRRPRCSSSSDAGPRCRAVAGLQFLGGRTECLAVLGGGEPDQPDGLSLLPLPEPQQACGIDAMQQQQQQQQHGSLAGATRLPWLGPILSSTLVPVQGALTGHEDPSALLALLEGGQVAVYDLSAATAPQQQQQQQQQQQPPPPVQHLFAGRLQSKPLVTAARLRMLPMQPVPLQGLQGASMSGLRAWAAATSSGQQQQQQQQPGRGGGGADRGQQFWSWVVQGGQAPDASSGGSSYASVYCTGHSDGCVRLWDMLARSPQLLGRAPSNAAHDALAASGRAKGGHPAVSTLEFAWEQGLLISGHEGGQLRVYQFSASAKRLECVVFESVGGRDNNEGLAIEEPAGFQLRLLTLLHSASIAASAYLPQTKMVAASDVAGCVSLIDLAQPAVLWLQAPWSGQPVVSLCLGLVPLPHHRDRHEGLAAHTKELPAGEPRRALLALAANSELAVLDAATGFCMSKSGSLVPKHVCPALHVELLDAAGAPTWIARDVQQLVALSDTPQQQQPQQQQQQQQQQAQHEQQRRQQHQAAAARLSHASASSGGPRLSSASAAGSEGLGSPAARSTGGGSNGSSGSPHKRGFAGAGAGQALPGPGSPAASAAAAAAAGRPASVSSQGAAGSTGGSSDPDLDSQAQQAGTAAAAAADRADRAGSSDGEGEGAAAGSDAELDVDELLAMAAAEAGGHSSPAAASSKRKDVSKGGGSSKSTTGGGASSKSSGGGSPLRQRTSSPSTGRARRESAPQQDEPGSGDEQQHARRPLDSRAPGGAPPAAASGQRPLVLSDPVAALVLVCARDYLRLYRVAHVASADRTTAKRVALPGPLQFAGAFVAEGAPALMCLLELAGEVQLQVYTLPGLQLVRDVSLSRLLGWPWSWDPRHVSSSGSSAATAASALAAPGLTWNNALTRGPSGALPHAAAMGGSGRHFGLGAQLIGQGSGAAAGAGGGAAAASRLAPAAAAITRHGHVALLGPGSELVRLGLAADAEAAPAAPVQVYDWDLAAAAHAAGRALEQQQLAAWTAAALARCEGGDASGGGGGGAQGARHAAGAAAGSEGGPGTPLAASGSSGGKPDIKGLMNKLGADIGGAARRALDETHKGLQKVVQVLESPEQLLAKGSGGPQLPQYPHPPLATLFAARPPPSSGAGVAASSPASSSSSSSRPAAGGPPGASQPRPIAVGPGPAALGAAARAELLRGASATAGSRPEPLAPPSARLAASVGSAGFVGSGGGGPASPSGPRVRSADEIRQAYGRAPLSKAQGVGGVMQQNRDLLAQRGETLGRLQEQTGDLAETAATFAELAKQLADKERSKARGWFG